MARVNLWLRGARGKFAGSSLSKGPNGETIAREVVSPSNPNTDKQLYQRMIMATVMSAYSAGKEIFDHSFQGKKKGSECQQEFMKLNLNALRSGIAGDINKIEAGDLTPALCQHLVTAPGVGSAVPNSYTVSKGDYQNSFLAVKFPQGKIVLAIPASLENETVAAYAKRIGLVPGDIYTLVGFSDATEEDPVFIGVDEAGSNVENWARQRPIYFQFYRMQVKADILQDTTAFTSSAAGALAKLLTFTGSKTSDLEKYALEDLLSSTFVCADMAASEEQPTTATGIDGFNTGAYGVIRSRFDRDLRSTTTLRFCCISDNELQCGLSCGVGLINWKKSTEAIGSSDKILES